MGMKWGKCLPFRIGPLGGIALANGVRMNKRLRSLALRQNTIKDKGACAFAQALST